eukprot:9705998-Alexandrium_andersonii.AAC.1
MSLLSLSGVGGFVAAVLGLGVGGVALGRGEGGGPNPDVGLELFKLPLREAPVLRDVGNAVPGHVLVIDVLQKVDQGLPVAFGVPVDPPRCLGLKALRGNRPMVPRSSEFKKEATMTSEFWQRQDCFR